jgi:cytochrome c oxidase subunit III
MDPSAHLEDHFEDLSHQSHALRLGMWLFLATEILLFGGLFIAYAYFRSAHAAGFVSGSRQLHRTLGAIETWVLITSSLSAALAVHFTERSRRRLSVVLLIATLLLGATFLVIHGWEYTHEPEPAPGAHMFFTVYYLMTGLHSLHVIAGIGVLAWMAWRVWSGVIGPAYYTPLECGALYWHLVDLIWIFLFPLLYLI